MLEGIAILYFVPNGVSGDRQFTTGHSGCSPEHIITPRLLTATALTVSWLGLGGSARNIIVSQDCMENVMLVKNIS